MRPTLVYPLAKTVAGFNIDAMNVYGRVQDGGHHRLEASRTWTSWSRPRPWPVDARPSRTAIRPRAAISGRTTSRWPSGGCR